MPNLAIVSEQLLSANLPLEGEMPGRAEGGKPHPPRPVSYRFKLPKIPRTSARPTCVATVRATLFIAASTTVSRW